MKLKLLHYFFIVIYFISCSIFAQDISLYKTFSGKCDFIFIGNTLNLVENNNVEGMPEPACKILKSSKATLNLDAENIVENAYLYWAGSGTGDFNVKLNDTKITATRTFTIENSAGDPFFSAFADVTSLIKTTGNGDYIFSDLDLTAVIKDYCSFGGNFGGWAIVIVYKNENAPVNLLNIYDGMQGIPNYLNIKLNNLFVIDNVGAKIGFIAWEGDKNIDVNESLRVNGNLIGNPPLNPENNAFNGSNSITNSDELYNMDLDVYDIQDYIKIGDKKVDIQLTSSQDFVMMNTIVTKINTQIIDATIAIDEYNLFCNSREFPVEYKISNLMATEPLPAGTLIAIYANDILIQKTQTLISVPENGSILQSIVIVIPESIPNEFELKLVVDDDGTGKGNVKEIDENNNSYAVFVSLWLSPEYNLLENLVSCNEGLGKGTFDFSEYTELVKKNPLDTVDFFENYADAESNLNPILNTTNYNITTPKEIYARIENYHCFSVTSFQLLTKNCPPVVYNFVTANNDGFNDTFYIKGLRDVFTNFQLEIYNRWGTLIWTGNNNTVDWDGNTSKGLVIGSSKVPDGTYFYILNLNDPDYQKPLSGYLYFTN